MKKSSHKFSNLIDVHSHILPQMDDGSKSPEMSLRMLRASASQGVRCIAATPHFYAVRDYPEHFLSKREKRMASLLEVTQPGMPVVIPGAEVMYFDGITEMSELPKLRIGRSKALLIEMPFRKWSNRVIEDIFELNSRREYRIILAHIERYLDFGNESAVEQLAENGILMQTNAEFFSGYWNLRRAVKMLNAGWIHLLGSDCHDTVTRPPNLSEACNMIADKLGKEVVESLMKRSLKVLLTEDTHSGLHKTGMRV